jgi:hypothetical protein
MQSPHVYQFMQMHACFLTPSLCLASAKISLLNMEKQNQSSLKRSIIEESDDFIYCVLVNCCSF